MSSTPSSSSSSRLAAQGRLRDVQPLGGTGEVSWLATPGSSEAREAPAPRPCSQCHSAGLGHSSSGEQNQERSCHACAGSGRGRCDRAAARADWSGGATRSRRPPGARRRATSLAPLGADAGRDGRPGRRVRRRGGGPGRAGGHHPPDDRAGRRSATSATSTRSSPARTSCGPRAPTTCSPPPRRAASRRFVAQSYTGWPNGRTGGPVKTEDDPLDPTRPRRNAQTLDAIRHLERAVPRRRCEGIVLRYGAFYGPGASSDQFAEWSAQRKLPLVGDGAGVWSFVHIDDAAVGDGRRHRARRAAASTTWSTTSRRRSPSGSRTWPSAVGAPPPRHVPAWLAGSPPARSAVSMMTQIRGSSNAKAKRELGWEPKLAELAGRLPARLTDGTAIVASRARGAMTACRMDAEASEDSARCCSRSPTGCWAASRGRGHRAGGVPALPPGARRRRAEIESPKAYLSAVATRLRIDQLRSARVRRETYVGEWLPEPLLTDEHAPDPAAQRRGRRLAVDGVPARCWSGSRRSSAPCSCCTTSSATATTRSPTSSARAEDNCRQLAVRARRHVDERAAAVRGVARASASELADAFFDAVGEGDIDGLVELLAADVVVYGDGGGRSPSWPRPIVGRDQVARLLLGLGRQSRELGVTVRARRDQRPAGRDLPRPGRPPDQRLQRSTSPTATCRPCARSSTRTSSRHLGPLADVRALMHQGKDGEDDPVADRGLRAHRRHARPRRWSAGTARSTGCACRASTRAACFAALLGDDGARPLADRPARPSVRAVDRRYRGDTLVLETEFETAERRGPRRSTSCRRATRRPDVVRDRRGRARAACRCRSSSCIRFDYGRIVPWVRARRRRAHARSPGPDALRLRTPRRDSTATDLAHRRRLHASRGRALPFVLTWHPSHEPAPRALDPGDARSHETEALLDRAGSAAAPTTGPGATRSSAR